jgi:hypothetical protein
MYQRAARLEMMSKCLMQAIIDKQQIDIPAHRQKEQSQLQEQKDKMQTIVDMQKTDVATGSGGVAAAPGA